MLLPHFIFPPRSRREPCAITKSMPSGERLKTLPNTWCQPQTWSRKEQEYCACPLPSWHSPSFQRCLFCTARRADGLAPDKQTTALPSAGAVVIPVPACKGIRRRAEGRLGTAPAGLEAPLFQSKLLPETKTDVLVRFLLLDFLEKRKCSYGLKGQEKEVGELAWLLTSRVL